MKKRPTRKGELGPKAAASTAETPIPHEPMPEEQMSHEPMAVESAHEESGISVWVSEPGHVAMRGLVAADEGGEAQPQWELAPPAVNAASMAALLVELESLRRAKLLNYRMEVGSRLARVFFGGDLRLYEHHRENPGWSWNEFVATYKAELRELGLSERTMRGCLRVWGVVTSFMAREDLNLSYSHYLELVPIESGPEREAIALQAAEEHWPVRVLRAEVAKQVGAKRGTGEEGGTVRPAVVVKQAKDLNEQLATFETRLQAVAQKRMSPEQRREVRAQLQATRAQLARLEALVQDTEDPEEPGDFSEE